ncbi:MAG: hypothetical protein FP826_05440 [Sphingomonadales bacterium]|nr:hypothetical protein [Sphingomonadales bacterium]MBU3991291.1 hypothetical protein [Alphaproteobacteria bacterium]
MRSDAPFDDIDFGELPDSVNELLQRGVIAHRGDRAEADRLFRAALALDPAALPTYLCLYKIHTYQGNLAEARTIAQAGLAEAARQAEWLGPWQHWPVAPAPLDGPGRFALYTLKALAFIALRDNRTDDAAEILTALRRLDPAGAVGWPVIAALADGIGEAVAA